jgi:hypothetical protein
MIIKTFRRNELGGFSVYNKKSPGKVSCFGGSPDRPFIDVKAKSLNTINP